MVLGGCEAGTTPVKCRFVERAGEISSAPYVSVSVPVWLKIVSNSSWPRTGFYILFHQGCPLYLLGFQVQLQDCFPGSPFGRRLWHLQQTASHFLFFLLTFLSEFCLWNRLCGDRFNKEAEQEAHRLTENPLLYSGSSTAYFIGMWVHLLWFCYFLSLIQSKNRAFPSTIFEHTSNTNLGVFFLINWFLCVF